MAKQEDVVMRKDGRMMMKKKGRITPMKEDLAIFDGMRVMLDGTIVMADGIARTMMEGEAITMDGRISDLEDMEEKNEPL